jgi:hypothetical protein
LGCCSAGTWICAALFARTQPSGYDIYLLPYAEHRNAGYIFLDLDYATAKSITATG